MLESCKVHGNNHKSCKFLLELQILSFLEKHCALLPLKLQENIIFSFWEKPKFVCQSFFQVKIMPHKKKRRLFPTISGAIFLRTLTYFSTTKVLSGPITMSQGRVLSQGFRFRKIHNFYCSIKDTLKWAFLFVLFFFSEYRGWRIERLIKILGPLPRFVLRCGQFTYHCLDLITTMATWRKGPTASYYYYQKFKRISELVPLGL